jgi:hypothetical protein
VSANSDHRRVLTFDKADLPSGIQNGFFDDLNLRAADEHFSEAVLRGSGKRIPT